MPAEIQSGNFPLDLMWAMGQVPGMERVIKDPDFRLVTEIQKPDAKRRLSLGQAIDQPGVAYNIYRNRLGQIVLDPVKAVPAYEAWIFENKEAFESVKRGLSDSAAGRTRTLGSFSAHAGDA